MKKKNLREHCKAVPERRQINRLRLRAIQLMQIRTNTPPLQEISVYTIGHEEVRRRLLPPS